MCEDLFWNHSNLTVSSSRHDILLCSKTLVSDMSQCWSCWFPYLVALHVVPGADESGPVGWLHMYKMDTEHVAKPTFECGCSELMFFRVYDVRQNFIVISLYRNHPLDDLIFDCLLTSMAVMQARDVCTSSMFVADLNGQHQEWLGSTTTNRHGVAAFDYSILPGCDQLVVGQTHARGGTLALVMIDVPDLVRVALVTPIGNSDHSSLSVVI